ncbi:MAG: hypothetical protein US49_C0005G0074 [candidate division TM6 bacterium GW2011_GWF2_37_49]|nr:MAG: hypothetical protein US49_C0005G0074 [candidate division TM6 bacterium GW2011_GWF2_37_49]
MRKFMLRLMLFVGLFAFGVVNACYNPNEIIEFVGSEVFIPARLGEIKLFRDQKGFHIFKDGKIYDVQNCFCDPADELTKSLFTMSNSQLKKFVGKDRPKMIKMTQEELEQVNLNDMIEIFGSEKNRIMNQLFGIGYISVNEVGGGEYIIRANIRFCAGGKDGVGKALKEGGAAAGVSAGVGLGWGAMWGMGQAAGLMSAAAGNGVAVSIFSLPLNIAYLGAAIGIETVAFPVFIIAGVVGAGYVGYQLISTTGTATATESTAVKDESDESNTTVEMVDVEQKSDEDVSSSPSAGNVFELNIPQSANDYF